MAPRYPAVRIAPIEVWHLSRRATYATHVHKRAKGRVTFAELERIMRTIIHENPAQIVRTMAHWFTVDETMRAPTLEGSDFVAPAEAVFVKARG